MVVCLFESLARKLEDMIQLRIITFEGRSLEVPGKLRNSVQKQLDDMIRDQVVKSQGRQVSARVLARLNDE